MKYVTVRCEKGSVKHEGVIPDVRGVRVGWFVVGVLRQLKLMKGNKQKGSVERVCVSHES